MSTGFSPRHHTAGSAGVNITGAQYFRKVLEVLGFPEEPYISGVGNGPRIKAQIAREWGQAILQALQTNRLREKQVADPGIMGGTRDVPYLDGPAEGGRSLEEHFFNPDGTAAPEIQDEMSVSSKEWLTHLANFFVASGGFTQS